MKLLVATNLWKTYGSTVVLERINVSVNEGEFITIVGASGCGKTTFLKLLLGTERQTRGELLLDSKPIAHEPGPDRGIVFQRYSVFPHLTVLQNALIGPELRSTRLSGHLFGASRKREKGYARAILKQVGLDNALHKYPFELSGGMQQRLAIVQSLMMRPRILLLDEPFGALDPGVRKDMHNLLLTLWQETGLTIFMTTHDIREGFYLGTRLWVFDKERVDAHAPDAYGARITFDLKTSQCGDKLFKKIVSGMNLPIEERND